jgi:hypothetical protein
VGSAQEARVDASRLRRSRLASWGWDYLVVLGWLALVFIVVGFPQLVGWIDLAWAGPVL